MARPGSVLNSGAFRFALIFSAVFAIAAFLMLGMVRHQIGRYAHDAMAGSLQAETATLMAEDRAALIPAIVRRTKAVQDGPFQYLLLDPAGRRLIGTIPASAAHPQDVAHYMGLYFMHSRGARLVDQVILSAAR